MTPEECFAFVEWTHSEKCEYLLGIDGMWGSLDNEVSVSTAQLYEIYLESLKQVSK